MKRVRFRDPAGSIRHGTWHGDEVAFGGRTWPIDEVDVRAPCTPSKVVCVGLNYAGHAEETGREPPDRPAFFLKPPNAVAAHGDVLEVPDVDRVDPEAELGVVVGEQCRDVDVDDAMDVVAGYTCVNDVSNRDDQRQEKNWVRGKAFDHACPIGPVVADPDDVPDDARIRCRVDGKTRQDSTIDELIFSVPELIAELTRYLTLEPGDVISTGTPSGVAPIESGGIAQVEIEGVGVLENRVVK